MTTFLTHLFLLLPCSKQETVYTVKNFYCNQAVLPSSYSLKLPKISEREFGGTTKVQAVIFRDV